MVFRRWMFFVLFLSGIFFVSGTLAQVEVAGGKGQAEAAVAGGQMKQPWTAHEVRLLDNPGEIVAILENGMTAIVKENHTAPVAAVRFYVRAGSIYEEQRLGAGLSHLFEHLLAGGATKNRTEEQSRQLIQQIGAKYNAYTTKNHTCYYLTVPAQHVGTALNLVADWVTRPTFPEDAFKREWAVVQRELEMGASDPERSLWKLYDELRYTVHPGHYPVIGYQAVVQQLKREDILAYYARMYVPDNSVIVVAGDINAEEMLGAIKKEYSDFVRRAKVNIVLPDEPEVMAPRETIQVFPAMQGPAQLLVGFPSFKLQDKDLCALDMLANIMGEGKSSRLYQRLCEREQLVVSVTAWNQTPDWADGTFSIMCEVEPDKIAAVRQVLSEEIAKIKEQDITAEELSRAKRQLQVGHIRLHQTAEQQAATMAQDYLATGDTHFSDRYVANMQQVTVEAVKDAACRYLNEQKQLTLILSPRPLPVDNKQQEKLAAEAESQVKKITLDNSLCVLLKRNPAVPLVNMQFYVMGGLMDESDADNGITNVMTELSLKGTKNYSARQIVDYFDGVGGSISVDCGNNTYFYSSETMSQDFGKAFDIFSEVVLSPTFSDEELGKLKPIIIAGIDSVKDSWPQEGNRFFREKFFVTSPYRHSYIGQKSVVSQLTSGQIADFHKNTMLAARAVLVIFGDINLQEVEQAVREKFSGIPAGTDIDFTRFSSEPAQEKERVFVQQTPKPGATVHVGVAGMKLTDIQDRYPMEVLMEIVGSNTGWLHELLRGKQLVYYAWGYSVAGLLPGYVVATAQCEAEKAPEVLELIRQQLAKAAKGGFTDDEIARAKSNLINSEILSKVTNADAAASAALDELYYLDCNWSKGNADRIMAVTRADVQAVATKYLSGPLTITVNTSMPQLWQNKEAK